MKPKISPEVYKSIIQTIRLDTLYLLELNVKYKEENVTARLDLDIKERHNFVQEDNKLKIYYTYKLAAKDEELDAQGISISCKYIVLYDVTENIRVSKDFINIFSEMTLELLLWPYFRELVNNVICRMNLPPLVLPMKRRG